MATGARRPSLARIGAGPERRGPPESGLRWRGTGIEPRRCSRPVRDAAPTIFCSDRLAADAGPGQRRSRLPQIRPDALDAPDFVGIGENPAREDGQRGRRSGGGQSLSTLPAGTTEAQVDDMMMVLEVADEATPAPSPA